MPANVRRWLDRATDRIRSMASAHQLFTTGAMRVEVDSLMKQVVAASTVNKPPNVHVETELGSAGHTLGPEQAVALAMIVNELCYNALIHGLREGGTLTIRAQDGRHAIDPSSPCVDQVVIEVVDDGCGCPETSRKGGQHEESPDSSCGSSGFGLELVSGLVRRELKGTFSLRSPAGGGTAARLEFPLPREEP